MAPGPSGPALVLPAVGHGPATWPVTLSTARRASIATETSYRRLEVVGALLILLGLARVIGGVTLVAAGGSVAYLLAGVGFAASGALL
jgi:hypothetical protein